MNEESLKTWAEALHIMQSTADNANMGIDMEYNSMLPYISIKKLFFYEFLHGTNVIRL